MSGYQTKLTAETRLVLLLCGHFHRHGRAEGVTPLDLREFNRITAWLNSRELRLDHLIDAGDGLISEVRTAGLDPDRLENLLSRGPSMALAVEQWQNHGIWILSRLDEAYPTRLLEHLGDGAPPLLFGVGPRDLLDRGGLAIIGSRNVDSNGKDFTREVARACGRDQIQIISGGARGVDQIAMLGGLEAGASVIGVTADSLTRAAVTSEFRKAIVEGRLTLVTPYAPDGRFTIGKAMGRNKVIYALADHALVVSTAKGAGGTWAGAVEELKRQSPRPIFIRLGTAAPPGNQALRDHGATPLPNDWEKHGLHRSLEVHSREKPTDPPAQMGLPFAMEPPTDKFSLGAKEPELPYATEDESAED